MRNKQEAIRLLSDMYGSELEDFELIKREHHHDFEVARCAAKLCAEIIIDELVNLNTPKAFIRVEHWRHILYQLSII